MFLQNYTTEDIIFTGLGSLVILAWVFVLWLTREKQVNSKTTPKKGAPPKPTGK